MLTEEEKEFLEFFSEYCKYTDNLEDYGINISPQEQETQQQESKQTTEKVSKLRLHD